MKTKGGFTLAEVMMVTLLFSIIVAAGSMVFISGQSIWSVTDANIRTQENLRRMLQRVSAELQESGPSRVIISDNTGVNGSDILRFAIPICPCGVQPMDSDGEVYAWGAPLQWGRSGCSDQYPVGGDGKVDVCHFLSRNPATVQTISVNENAVRSHLAHGDWIGDCSSCNPASYNNRFIEYRIVAENRFMRRVLKADMSVISQEVVADGVSDFQVAVTGPAIVQLTAFLSQTASQDRVVAITDSVTVFLRN